MSASALPMFSGAVSERRLQRMGKVFTPKPPRTKSRKEPLAALRPKDLQFPRADNGELPAHFAQPEAAFA
jgi:hypothetical protein